MQKLSHILRTIEKKRNTHSTQQGARYRRTFQNCRINLPPFLYPKESPPNFFCNLMQHPYISNMGAVFSDQSPQKTPEFIGTWRWLLFCWAFASQSTVSNPLPSQPVKMLEFWLYFTRTRITYHLKYSCNYSKIYKLYVNNLFQKTVTVVINIYKNLENI